MSVVASLDRRRENKQSRQLLSLLKSHFQLVAGKKRCVVSVVSVCKILLRYGPCRDVKKNGQRKPRLAER